MGRVISALLDSCGDWDRSVRETIVVSLPRITPFGHRRTISTLGQRLADDDMCVRRQAARALEQVAPKDDPSVKTALMSMLHAGGASELQREDATTAWRLLMSDSVDLRRWR